MFDFYSLNQAQTRNFLHATAPSRSPQAVASARTDLHRLQGQLFLFETLKATFGMQPQWKAIIKH